VRADSKSDSDWRREGGGEGDGHHRGGGDGEECGGGVRGWRRWYAAAGAPTVTAAPRVEVRIQGFGRIHRRWLRGGQRAAGDRCAGR
jgi:hypothetical protein